MVAQVPGGHLRRTPAGPPRPARISCSCGRTTRRAFYCDQFLWHHHDCLRGLEARNQPGVVMNRGGRNRIARRLMAAAAMLGLGIAVVGGGVAFADDTAGSGTPASTVPGVVSDYRVDTPSVRPVPV